MANKFKKANLSTQEPEFFVKELVLEPTDLRVVCTNREHNLWAIRRSHGRRYNKVTDKFDFEPFPSSRTEEWISNHSFDDLEEAKQAAMLIAEKNIL